MSFSFDDYSEDNHITPDYLLNKGIDKLVIESRITDNIIENKIVYHRTYIAHVKYALENNLNDIIPAVITKIRSGELKNHECNTIISHMFDYNQGTELLKAIFEDLSTDTQIHYLQELIRHKDFDFASEKLMYLHNALIDSSDIMDINNMLISLGKVEGLEYSIKWINENKTNPFGMHGIGLAHFKDIKALPYLMEILQLSYDKSIVLKNEFDSIYGRVLEGLKYLALASKDNLNKVTHELNQFIESNKGILENVGHIKTSINEVYEQYYKDNSIKYDFKKAIKIANETICVL